MTTHPSPEELHLLYILLDPNLPTGGFIASSGLESYAKHGFIHSSNPSNTKTAEGVVRFAKAEVENYGATTGGFVRDAWGVMDSHLEGRSWKGKAKELGGSTVHEDGRGVQSPDATEAELKVEETVRALQDLDAYHESTLLSHVARRSSKAQGVAMLTLYTRGLSIPSVPGSSFSASASNENTKEARARKVVEGYKRSIRGGKSSGHLAICWGVMTAALALSLGECGSASSFFTHFLPINLVLFHTLRTLTLHLKSCAPARCGVTCDPRQSCLKFYLQHESLNSVGGLTKRPRNPSPPLPPRPFPPVLSSKVKPHRTICE